MRASAKALSSRNVGTRPGAICKIPGEGSSARFDIIIPILYSLCKFKGESVHFPVSLPCVVRSETKDDRRPSPGGTLSPQSADGTRLHSLGESNAGRGVPPRGVGTARRVCGATHPDGGRRPGGGSEGASPKAETLRGSVGAPQGAEIAHGRRLRRRSKKSLNPYRKNVSKKRNVNNIRCF